MINTKICCTLMTETMPRMLWNLPTSKNEAYRRAGGRRRYNSYRKLKASFRLKQVIELYMAGIHNKSEIARQLGVHRSTITRDFQRSKVLQILEGLW